MMINDYKYAEPYPSEIRKMWRETEKSYDKRTIEERLYDCCKLVFEEFDGKCNKPLNGSIEVFRGVGFHCADHFIDEMYERWINEKKEKKDVGK